MLAHSANTTLLQGHARLWQPGVFIAHAVYLHSSLKALSFMHLDTNLVLSVEEKKIFT